MTTQSPITGNVATPSGAIVNASTGSLLTPPPVSQTMDASSIGAAATSPGIIFPNNTPSSAQIASNGMTSNASIPSPIPTAESIINTSGVSSPAETKQKSILDRIAGLVGGNKGQQTLTNEAEAAAGIPGLTKVTNDLTTQILGLNDQATALANEAAYTIPNQVQLDNRGSGVTKASTAARSADALRMNQIKQGAIASQSLTLKAAYYAAQGNLILAKDSADKAATAQYEDQQQQIDYQKALLDALGPDLTKEENNRLALQKAQLDDRQMQINNAQDDKKSAIAMAAAALKNFPNDPTAHFAAQQALAESNKQQPDLQKIFDLVGKYQTDPNETQKAVLDLQLTRAQIASTNASTAKTNLETKQLGAPATGGLDTKIQEKVDEQNALDAQTVSSAYQSISGILGSHGIMDPSKITVAQADKLSDVEVESLAKALARIQNPDIARQGGDAGNALSPNSLLEKGSQLFRSLVGGKKYLPAKIVEAVKNAATINSSKGLSSLNSSAGKPAKGTDGAAYGHPGYVSDGTQWVAK